VRKGIRWERGGEGEETKGGEEEWKGEGGEGEKEKWDGKEGRKRAVPYFLITMLATIVAGRHVTKLETWSRDPYHAHFWDCPKKYFIRGV